MGGVGRRMQRCVHGIAVHGVGVDAQTRCAHYHSPVDVIALRFPCCDAWYPCIECHEETADHAPTVWPITERETRAVLCGVCGTRLTISAYLACESRCPRCQTAFNPGCATHHHLYFEVP